MKKERVSIRFPSLNNLWAFKSEIETDIFDLTLSEMMITCDCTQEHIEMAITRLGGKLVERKQEKAERS